MTRKEVVGLARSLGFKRWGKLRPYKNGSKYQCFRRGNDYAWIGNYYVEVSTSIVAEDYINSTPGRVRLFLGTGR